MADRCGDAVLPRRSVSRDLRLKLSRIAWRHEQPNGSEDHVEIDRSPLACILALQPVGIPTHECACAFVHDRVGQVVARADLGSAEFQTRVESLNTHGAVSVALIAEAVADQIEPWLLVCHERDRRRFCSHEAAEASLARNRRARTSAP